MCDLILFSPLIGRVDLHCVLYCSVMYACIYIYRHVYIYIDIYLIVSICVCLKYYLLNIQYVFR